MENKKTLHEQVNTVLTVLFVLLVLGFLFWKPGDTRIGDLYKSVGENEKHSEKIVKMAEELAGLTEGSKDKEIQELADKLLAEVEEMRSRAVSMGELIPDEGQEDKDWSDPSTR